MAGLNGNISRLLSRHGSPWTIRRAAVAAGSNAWTAGSTTVTYEATRGHRRRLELGEVRGIIHEGDAILVLPPSLSAAPKEGDKAASGTHTSDSGVEWLQILAVMPVEIGGVLAGYRCQIKE